MDNIMLCNLKLFKYYNFSNRHLKFFFLNNNLDLTFTKKQVNHCIYFIFKSLPFTYQTSMPTSTSPTRLNFIGPCAQKISAVSTLM